MKQTFDFVGRMHIAFDRRKYCNCGSHEYVIFRSKDEPVLWHVKCLECGRPTLEYETKREALRQWKEV